MTNVTILEHTQTQTHTTKQFAILHALPSCLHDHHTTMGPQQQEQELQCRAVANFHRRVQKLAPWFIESEGVDSIVLCMQMVGWTSFGDCCCTYTRAVTQRTTATTQTPTDGDDVDPQAGEWELLYLVQRPASAQQQQQEQEQGQGADGDKKSVVLVGYLTTYAFNNPLKGKGLRVCQALVLPPFQRQGACAVCACAQRCGGASINIDPNPSIDRHNHMTRQTTHTGHGQRLLRAAYALARARDVVFEVTVEDPCPGFAALRAVIDTEDVRALCKVGRRLWWW